MEEPVYEFDVRCVRDKHHPVYTCGGWPLGKLTFLQWEALALALGLERSPLEGALIKYLGCPAELASKFARWQIIDDDRTWADISTEGCVGRASVHFVDPQEHRPDDLGLCQVLLLGRSNSIKVGFVQSVNGKVPASEWKKLESLA
jgi:hypothetical protein